MKKLLSISLALFLFQSFVVSAGIKDKKIKLEADANIKISVLKVKKACGNKKLTAKINWSNWEKLKKAEMLKFIEASKNGVIPEVFDYIEKTCQADELYKEEIAKLTSINLSGKESKSEMYAAFILKDTVLEVQVNLDGYGSWKNEELLKKVWE